MWNEDGWRTLTARRYQEGQACAEDGGNEDVRAFGTSGKPRLVLRRASGTCVIALAGIIVVNLRRFLGELSYRSRSGGQRDLPFYRARIGLLQSINWLERMAHRAIYWSPLRSHILPRYRQQMTPAQLHCLCTFLQQTADVPGRVVEVGCAEGRTTFFLYNFMREIGSRHEYVALDTFAGFTKSDVRWEVTQRSKREGMYIAFRNNSHARFRSMLRLNGINEVTSIEADANHFDMRDLAPVSFALLDVDLYRPTKKSLSELYDSLSPGGILIVDDCDRENYYWDGAYQAYSEFMSQRELPERILFLKLGVIEKPRAAP